MGACWSGLCGPSATDDEQQRLINDNQPTEPQVDWAKIAADYALSRRLPRPPRQPSVLVSVTYADSVLALSVHMASRLPQLAPDAPFPLYSFHLTLLPDPSFLDHTSKPSVHRSKTSPPLPHRSSGGNITGKIDVQFDETFIWRLDALCPPGASPDDRATLLPTNLETTVFIALHFQSDGSDNASQVVGHCLYPIHALLPKKPPKSTSKPHDLVEPRWIVMDPAPAAVPISQPPGLTGTLGAHGDTLAGQPASLPSSSGSSLSPASLPSSSGSSLSVGSLPGLSLLGTRRRPAAVAPQRAGPIAYAKLRFEGMDTGTPVVLIEEARVTNPESIEADSPLDFYVKIYAVPDDKKRTKQKTTVKKGSYAPYFHEPLRLIPPSKGTPVSVLQVILCHANKMRHRNLADVIIDIPAALADQQAGRWDGWLPLELAPAAPGSPYTPYAWPRAAEGAAMSSPRPPGHLRIPAADQAAAPSASGTLVGSPAGASGMAGGTAALSPGPGAGASLSSPDRLGVTYHVPGGAAGPSSPTAGSRGPVSPGGPRTPVGAAQPAISTPASAPGTEGGMIIHLEVDDSQELDSALDVDFSPSGGQSRGGTLDSNWSSFTSNFTATLGGSRGGSTGGRASWRRRDASPDPRGSGTLTDVESLAVQEDPHEDTFVSLAAEGGASSPGYAGTFASIASSHFGTVGLTAEEKRRAEDLRRDDLLVDDMSEEDDF
ncbi:hypothetical protein H696_05565 [Fonticula alba]|uniref:C2 domain-containing protein n=1 Tax=Fonticula alba TaxID=691883 RepID=A0A058Z1M0_FONAL|nr:hypothetical protein H696_05565 [Fonticula alba]KCV67833.1 hypothetical protein H696_05565 [Fonticula alba]|eukprot:XP_009497653.1 hypothetical protein H696_05565 [Fonticula alba]